MQIMSEDLFHPVHIRFGRKFCPFGHLLNLYTTLFTFFVIFYILDNLLTLIRTF